MKNKKEKLVVILLIVGLIVMTVAISYAAFRFTQTGSVLNQITTGSITMSYTESSNVISMTGALPTTDATGKVRLNEGEYFDFTVGSSITGTANINYEIAAQELEGNTIDGSYIKYYLTKVNDDNSEEEVMAPSTYTAETSANEYTGRPANMMSLYEGSMSSSTTTKYRLRLYVDESYNPQGDGGNLVYKTKVNVYGLAGEETSGQSQIVTKLLADNPVQETIDGMFIYTSEGKTNGSDTVNSTYVTNGVYMMEDEDGPSYYFRGNVDNIVQFGSYEADYYVYQNENGNQFQTLESCQSYNDYEGYSECNQVVKYAKGTPMYFRIVRVNGDGTLRLLYSGTSKDATGDDLMIGHSWYNSIGFEYIQYTGYTYDNGVDSLVKKEVDEWYKNALSNSSYDKYVASGRFCSDSTGFNHEEYDGILEYFASYDRLSAGSPTLICPEITETFGGSYRLKAGLMTADEMTLGGDKNSEDPQGAYIRVESNNYLSSGTANYWTMTPNYIDMDYIFVWSHDSGLDYYSPVGLGGVRPVINLLTDNGLTLTGSGSSIDPYVIK